MELFNKSVNLTESGHSGYLSPSVDIPSLIALVASYALILAIGIWASFRNNALKSDNSEDVMVAGRNIGTVLGVITLTATWVGGGYINGAAEMIYKEGYGLAWCQAPIGYSLSLFFGGLIFAKKMSEAGYVTMLDPFEVKYGKVMAAILYIPALFGDTFWSAAVLSALGASLHIILGLSHMTSVIISTCIAIGYTVIGGLYSVALTDVVQLIFIAVGLILATIFAMMNDAVTDIRETAAYEENSWLGTLEANSRIGEFIDKYLLLIFGGIPWQVYFQRVLSLRDPENARILSFAASFFVSLLGIPPILLGAIGKSTDWNATDYRFYGPVPPKDYKTIVPLVLQYVCPKWVSVIGLGAISAAVMSSADSSMLSASTMFARNVYAPIRNALGKKPASEVEIIWAMRVGVLLAGSLAMGLAITIDSIYGLFLLCSDLTYVILFPQLLLVVYLPFANTYGSVAGYFIGAFFRLTSGDPLISVPALLKYPFFDEETGKQHFPVRTFAMLMNLLTIIMVSYFTDWLFKSKRLALRYDILKCFHSGQELGNNVSSSNDPESKEALSSDETKDTSEFLDSNDKDANVRFLGKNKKRNQVNGMENTSL